MTSDVDKHLLDAARAAALHSYSPYSKFRVGAAVRSGTEIFVGTNVENASYGLTICAERVAIFSAVAAGKRSIDAVAISCVDVTTELVANIKMPCGACRQVISEFANESTRVLVEGAGTYSLDQLLPSAFRLRSS
jgi:cytidine deaminase